jgi:hypothetical protein
VRLPQRQQRREEMRKIKLEVARAVHDNAGKLYTL